MARRSRLDILVNADTKRAVSGLGAVGARIGGIAKGVAKLGAGAAIAGLAAFGTGLRSIAKDSITLGVEMDKVLKLTGISEKALAGLRVAAIQEHASFQTLASGLKFLSRAMEEAKNETELYEDAFKDLKIDPATVADRPLINVFRNVADEIRKMESPTKRIQVAMDLFGRSGAEMVPLLSLGGQFLRDMEREAVKAGLVIEGIAGKSKIIDDNFTTLKLKIEGLKLQAFAGFADELLKATDAFNSLDFVKMGKDIGAGVGDLIANMVLLTQGQTRLQQGITNAIQPSVNVATQSQFAGDNKFETAIKVFDRAVARWVSSITGIDPGQ